jgi:hypothetical protein
LECASTSRTPLFSLSTYSGSRPSPAISSPKIQIEGQDLFRQQSASVCLEKTEALGCSGSSANRMCISRKAKVRLRYALTTCAPYDRFALGGTESMYLSLLFVKLTNFCRDSCPVLSLRFHKYLPFVGPRGPLLFTAVSRGKLPTLDSSIVPLIDSLAFGESALKRASIVCLIDSGSCVLFLMSRLLVALLSITWNGSEIRSIPILTFSPG